MVPATVTIGENSGPWLMPSWEGRFGAGGAGAVGGK